MPPRWEGSEMIPTCNGPIEAERRRVRGKVRCHHAGNAGKVAALQQPDVADEERG